MSSTQQLRTMRRLVDMKERDAEAAERAFAEAHAEVVRAEAEVERAERRWNDAVGAADEVVCAGDLEDRDAMLRALRRGVEIASDRLMQVRSIEESARDAMTRARIELRKFETWRDRVLEGVQLEQRRIERIAEDEVAARKKQDRATS